MDELNTPSPCAEDGPASGWEPTRTFAIGDVFVGVRASTPWADEVIGKLLGPHEVFEPEVPSTYSVELRPPETRGMSWLARGCQLVVRSRDPARVLRGLESYLSSQHVDGANVIRLFVTAFAKGERIVLAPSDARVHFPRLQRRFDRAGIAIVDAPFVGIDPASGDAVLPTVQLDLDPAVLAAVHVPSAITAEPEVVASRLSVVAWAFRPSRERVSRATLLAEVLPAVVDLESLDRQVALDGLARAIGRAEPLSIGTHDPNELYALIATALSA